MKKTLLISILFCATKLLAQEQNSDVLKYQQEVSVLKRNLNKQQAIINQQQTELMKFFAKNEVQEKLIDSLKVEIQNNTRSIRTITDDLGTKILKAEINASDSISRLDMDINMNRIFWIIATLATLLLGAVTYWLLGKRIRSSITDVETQIRNTKIVLEEECIKLDAKLIEVLEGQLKLKKEEMHISSPSNINGIDHSLALKVADEIIRIQKNLLQMDSGTKGLKQLSASVKRIQDNFASNGYELVEMLGKEYNEGMKLVANFIPSEDLEKGKQVISRIIKPQVNFKNEMIQAAQIEVSVGE